jgi:hypothetical protein
MEGDIRKRSDITASARLEIDDNGNLYITIGPGAQAIGTVAQGAAGLVTAPWYVRLSDGAAAYKGATEPKQDDLIAGVVLVAATQTDGTQKAIVRGGAKGATTAADVTSTAGDADHQGLNVVELLAPAYEDGVLEVAATHHKPLASGVYAWSVSILSTSALVASKEVKSSAGVLRWLRVRLDSTAANGTYYLQILNAAALPADGAVTHLLAPIKVIHANGADDTIQIDLTDNGVYASAGIVVCLSTTEFTKTIAGAYLCGTVLYK